MRLIDADSLKKELAISGSCNNCEHNGIFGCREDICIADVCGYIHKAKTVNAIPVKWIKKYEETDDLAGSIYRMLEEWWKVGLDKEWEEFDKEGEAL